MEAEQVAARSSLISCAPRERAVTRNRHHGRITHEVATIDLLEQRRSELVEVCPRFQVESLEVFGSAAVGPWDPAEAISIFSCNFSPLWHGQLFDNFFDLKIEPQNLFGRNVDLVLPRSIRNPYFLASVNRTRQALYAA